MTIQYENGNEVEGILLSRSDDAGGNRMRVALKDSDDVMEFSEVQGSWFTEDGEPVAITFEWQRRPRRVIPTEADCICPQELASRLVRMLTLDSEDSEPTRARAKTAAAGGLRLV